MILTLNNFLNIINIINIKLRKILYIFVKLKYKKHNDW
jgi:hypothetical protein